MRLGCGTPSPHRYAGGALLKPVNIIEREIDMELQLTNGRQHTVQAGSATYGYHIESITLNYRDIRNLLSMKDGELREYLGVLFTRFPPNTGVKPNGN
jgi:hypothetical protein